MQSLLTFIAEFQTAKNNCSTTWKCQVVADLLWNLTKTIRGCDSLKAVNLSENTPMYESRETSSHGVLSDTLRCNQNRIG